MALLKPGVNLPATTWQDDYVQMMGGFDQTTPTLRAKNGMARVLQNFEVSLTGGYLRCPGYEPADGRPSPADAVYLTATMNITGSLAVGDAIYGVTSGATGEVSYINGTLVAYTKASGTFTAGESVKVPNGAGTVRASITDVSGAEDAADFDARMRHAAAEIYRAEIGAVPGSGIVRCVVLFNGVVYAMRNDAGATALVIYKQTASGWTLVAMPNTISFTLGSAEYVEGDTLTRGGASATIKRVCVESGSWGAGDAAGRLIIGAVTGGPFTAGVAGGGGVCTLAGAEAAVALLPITTTDGTVDFDVGQVGGTRLMYCADGINKGWEFGGDYVAPIVTGTVPDTPEHVMVHQGHLFLSFGNSVVHSGIGEPFTYTALAGAGEFLADGNITAMRVLPGQQSTGAAMIGHEAGAQVVYGTAEPFQLVSFEDSAGVKAGTVQRMGQVFILDDRGVVTLATSQNFGNFAASTLTIGIRPWIEARRNLATASVVSKSKNQYRLFFSDGSGLYATIANGKLLGLSTVVFPDVVRCACFGETADGEEAMYFGSDDGWVYRMDRGTSFNGASIDYEMTLVPANQGNPRLVKRYRKATFEIQSDYYAAFNVTFELGYATTSRLQQDVPDAVEASLAGGQWDSGTWDAQVWDGRQLAPEELRINGSGENISMRVIGESAICEAFTINSAIINYSVRKRMR